MGAAHTPDDGIPHDVGGGEAVGEATWLTISPARSTRNLSGRRTVFITRLSNWSFSPLAMTASIAELISTRNSFRLAT